MDTANNLGFSPEFVRKYSKSSSTDKEKDKGVIHIWALANYYKLLSLINRLKKDGISQKDIMAGYCTSIPRIDTSKRKSDIEWYTNKDTGENVPGILVRYQKETVQRKVYTHGCKTTTSIFELTTINNSENFAIDTRSFMKDDYKNAEKTNPLIKEMAERESDVSVINRIRSCPEIAMMVNSYKDLILLPCSDMKIQQIVDGGEDRSIIIPLDEFFIPLSASPEEMYQSFMHDSGANEANTYLDNIKIN